MHYSVIAIEREYASGGREVGEKLASALGVPFLNQQILKIAADKLGQPADQLSRTEESINSGLSLGFAALLNVASGESPSAMPVAQQLMLAETRIIHDLATQPCVIVGRAAAGILKDQRKTLTAFIHADQSARAARAIETYDDNPRQVDAILQRNDRRRSAYFAAATNLEWRNPDLYHLFLNSGRLGIDQTVEVLLAAVG